MLLVWLIFRSNPNYRYHAEQCEEIWHQNLFWWNFLVDVHLNKKDIISQYNSILSLISKKRLSKNSVCIWGTLNLCYKFLSDQIMFYMKKLLLHNNCQQIFISDKETSMDFFWHFIEQIKLNGPNRKDRIARIILILSILAIHCYYHKLFVEQIKLNGPNRKDRIARIILILSIPAIHCYYHKLFVERIKSSEIARIRLCIRTY